MDDAQGQHINPQTNSYSMEDLIEIAMYILGSIEKYMFQSHGTFLFGMIVIYLFGSSFLLTVVIFFLPSSAI